nr:MAG TPA: Baseplate wedge protein [Caudoviricetes sp.]
MFERYKRPTLQEILSRMQGAVREIDPTIDLTENSVLGQLLGIVADEADLAYQYAEYCAMQTFRPTASGAALDAIASLVGVSRLRGNESGCTILYTGTLPDAFQINGVQCKVVRRFSGRFGYLRSSVRYPNSGYQSEASLPQGVLATGDVLVHARSSYDNALQFPIVLAGTVLDAATITGANLSGSQSIQVGGATIYCPVNMGVVETAAESDDVFRERIKLATDEVGGTLAAIQSAITRAIGPCLVTEWIGPGIGPNGQMPNTIHVQFSAPPSRSRVDIANAIKAARPAGIASWAPAGASHYNNESWSIASSRDVVVIIVSSLTYDGAVDRSAVESIIRAFIGSHPANTVLHVGKLEAKIVNDVANMQSISMTIAGVRDLPASPQAINITEIKWQ